MNEGRSSQPANPMKNKKYFSIHKWLEHARWLAWAAFHSLNEYAHSK